MRSKQGASSPLSLPPLIVLLLTSTLLSLVLLGPMHGERLAASAEELAPTPVADDASHQTEDGSGSSPDAGADDDEPALGASSEPDGWTAGETSVSGLSDEEQRALCGLPMEVLEWEDEQASQQPLKLSASYTYPPALDWRNYNGGNYTTPVRNQGGCASCAAFATAAAIESRMEIAQGQPGLNPNLSEAHLHYCGAGASCGSGAGPMALMDFARDTGVVDEACFPYTGQNQACSPCQGWQNRVTQLFDWIGMVGVADMKQALADDGPFEATMVVYSDFFDYSGGVYRHTSGGLQGGHGVTIVGYNDYGGYWIAKNSWGTGWGENGWFRIAYGECAIDNYAYVPFVDEPSFSRVNVRPWPEDGGTVVADPPECTLDGCETGTEVVLTANPSYGYKFSSWHGDLSGWSNPTTMVVDRNREVFALFVFSCDECTPQAFVPFVVR
jgi:C1A family cysteine protease